ncbi:MAG: ISAs1 family transposase [Spirochaetota bacterium]
MFPAQKLKVKGCIVTIDAEGCQTEIAKKIRECYHSDEISALSRVKEFAGAKSIAMVRSTRLIGEKRTTQVRYGISSLETDAEQLAHAVRTHWSVENGLHWALDMSFREDDSRMREGYSAENFAMVRRMALSICAYHDPYLQALLFNSDKTIAAIRPH